MKIISPGAPLSSEGGKKIPHGKNAGRRSRISALCINNGKQDVSKTVRHLRAVSGDVTAVPGAREKIFIN